MLNVACHMLSMEGCMLSAADAVVLSNYGSNGCPTGYARITSESECARAAAAIGQRFDGTETDAACPSGCYSYTRVFEGGGEFNATFFNMDPVGDGE
jgi:hypothetical protein